MTRQVLRAETCYRWKFLFYVRMVRLPRGQFCHNLPAGVLSFRKRTATRWKGCPLLCGSGRQWSGALDGFSSTAASLANSLKACSISSYFQQYFPVSRHKVLTNMQNKFCFFFIIVDEITTIIFISLLIILINQKTLTEKANRDHISGSSNLSNIVGAIYNVWNLTAQNFSIHEFHMYEIKTTLSFVK